MTHPDDYTYCSGCGCRLRESCRRYVCPVPPDVYVTMMAPPADPDRCDKFVLVRGAYANSTREGRR